MNWLIILGIIVIGVGTYIVYLGSDLNSQKTQEDIIKKIEQTQSNIEDLKSKSSNDTIKTELQDIENEFILWADEFIKSKESKKLVLEKKKISSSESRIKESARWLPGYLVFFNVVKKSIDAYNTKTKSDIRYKLPNIPNNIFINSEEKYSGSIFFKDDIVWEFIIKPPKKFEKNYKPDLTISIYTSDILNKNDIHKLGNAIDQFTIIIFDEDLRIHKFTNERLNLEYLKDKYKLTTPEEAFGDIAKDLIEAQLLQL